MRKSNLTAVFDADVQTVWDLVTDNSDCTWRSDLEKIEIVDSTTFIEYAKGGAKTTFTITGKQPCKRYAFAMQNKNFTGNWTGLFQEAGKGRTRIDFTEELYIKNPVMELLSHLFFNLKKMQRRYADDLRNRLG